ncbi:Nitrogen assimilation transcription factor nirA [Madurella mycetomatis]|uniref:Nitrogen assimilation transcription factor nirA n=1 Tax=Madurella mycetomatis TaxID=100816 RepID=A0A175W9Q0_9PEZI|nr:Nitrogen assimilation transcription factor nirA [Madurella mycetomatis]
MDEFVGTWTNVTSDVRLVRHLLDLYFCWEYPTLASLSREHFLKDFEAGCSRYCSSLLVNSLLALGSRFSDRPEFRAKPDGHHTAGDEFFKEAQRLFLELEDHNEVTVVQALGIMAIREASFGRDLESRYYAGQSVRLAIEMGLHRVETYNEDDEESSTVRLITFWGAFALDNAWSLTTGALPHFSCAPRLPPKVKIIQEVEDSLWVPYTDDGLVSGHACEQPGHIRTVYNYFCELSEIVHASLYRLYCAARKPTSHDILEIYTKYLSWYDNIPDLMRFGTNFTPQVLFVHLYYHFAITLTFRPFVKLRIRGSRILPRQLCLQAADAIQGHLRSYSRLYSLRRTPSFVPYIIVVSSRIYLTVAASTIPGPPPRVQIHQQMQGDQPHPTVRDLGHTTEALNRNIASLEDMSSCHCAALIGVNMLRYLTRAWDIYVGIKSSLEAGHVHTGYDPYPASLSAASGPNPFASRRPGQAGGGDDMTGIWALGATLGESASDDEDPLQRALSWPAPRQTPFVVPTESMLEEAGFESL